MKSPPKTSQQRTYIVTSFIPKGKVLTYKMLAHYAHVTNPRLVGNYLHHNEDPVNIPCHRVVNSQGRCAKTYAFGGLDIQLDKLRKEGIKTIRSNIDLGKYLWQPDEIQIKKWDELFNL
jgi:methylated-DNA-protein-cysteine methyltransferase related protein